MNSALDNPTNFFTSSSLQSRANDLSALMDSMTNGVKTLEAADNGLTSITKTLESMQSTLRQARQDKTYRTADYTVDLGATPAGTETLSLSDGAIGSTPVDIDLTTAQVVDHGRLVLRCRHVGLVATAFPSTSPSMAEAPSPSRSPMRMSRPQLRRAPSATPERSRPTRWPD